MWILITVLLGLSTISTLIILSALLLTSSSISNNAEPNTAYAGTESLSPAPVYIE